MAPSLEDSALERILPCSGRVSEAGILATGRAFRSSAMGVYLPTARGVKAA